MSIRVKNALSSALSPVSGKQLGSLTFLGSGGPFDVAESTSSVLVGIGEEKGSILVDCGPQIYSNMRRQLLGLDVNTIILTSSEESSIGSLGTLVSHLYQMRKTPVRIICSSSVAPFVFYYLLEICHVDPSWMTMPTLKDNVYIDSFDDSDFNAQFMGPHSFVLEIGDGISNGVNILYSGRIDSAVFSILNDSWMNVLKKKASDTIVIHDACFSPTPNRCHYEALEEWSETFRNFFIVGHDQIDGEKMVFSQRRMRSASTNKDNNEFVIEKQLGNI